MRPLYEVADILQSNIGQINKLTANSWQARTLYALASCRTHLLGGHIGKTGQTGSSSHLGKFSYITKTIHQSD